MAVSEMERNPGSSRTQPYFISPPLAPQLPCETALPVISWFRASDLVDSKLSYEESGPPPPVSISVQSKLFLPSALVPSISLTTISCLSASQPLCCQPKLNCFVLTWPGARKSTKSCVPCPLSPRCHLPLSLSSCPLVCGVWGWSVVCCWCC